MKRDVLFVLAAALAALLLFSGPADLEPQPCDDCALQQQPPEKPKTASADLQAPVVDIPIDMRSSNWGGGSCVHASTVMLLHWQDLHEMAAWWRARYEGGEYSDRLHRRLEEAGLRYAFTVDGEEEFLDWALRTRRGAGITYFPSHAVNLVHLDEHYAALLDNNNTDRLIWIPREEFVRRWREHGGWAWTLVYDPPPPTPFAIPNGGYES